MKTILLISPYWKEEHRWMVSSFKLAELWQRIGYKVVVACMGAETSREEISPTLTLYRKKDFFLPDPWNYGIAPGFTGMVRKIIKDEKPDIIVCNKILFWSSFSVIALTLTGKKVVLLTDALVGMTWWGRSLLFRLASRIYAWTFGWLIMLCAEKIVFFHPQPEKLLRFLRVHQKSTVIPTGIDPAPYAKQTDPSRTSDPSSSSNYAEASKLTITYIGRLESVKGVDDFLAAAVPLKKIFPDITIQVVGWYPSTSSGEANHPLVEQYRHDVVFTGLRKDVPAILGKTDIFVMPSHSEGLSNAIMEAMASACACVVTDVGGNGFLIQNGVSGLLFPPKDREALRSHIRRLIEDSSKRTAMGYAALVRILDMFSWSVVGKKYNEFFSNIPNS